MSKTAYCNCGALRAEIDGAPDAVVACHCIDCQKRTGSVLGVGAYYHKDRIRIAGGSKEFVRDTASGRKFRQNFCPVCGTTVFWTVDIKPDAVGIAVGCFADPNFPAPQRSVWEQSRHAWLELPPGIQHYPRGRAG